MREASVRIEAIHTSGHVAEADLRDFIKALAPAKIIPVHGENWARDHAGLPELLRLADGEAYEIGSGDRGSDAS